MSDAVELPDHFLPARIESIEQVTPLIKVFTLAADPQRFTSKAGQWLDLVIPQPEGKPFVGGYSVVSAPRADGRLQLAIKYADHHHATHHLHASRRKATPCTSRRDRAVSSSSPAWQGMSCCWGPASA